MDLEDFGNMAVEPVFLEVRSGEVDRDAIGRDPRRKPRCHVARRPVDNPSPQGGRQTAVRKGLEEFTCGNDGPVRREHSCQNLETADRPVADPDDGLVVVQDTPLFQRITDRTDRLHPLHHRGAQGGLEEDEAASPGLLGMIER